MKSLSLSQASKMQCYPFSIWIRWSSLITLVASIGFLSISLFTYSYYAFFSASLVPSLLVALSFAVFLNIYSLWYLRREHRKTELSFRNTDCEFSSVFENVLDGILILDDEADCLDANPGAAAMLRFSINKLIGQNVSHFFAERDAFKETWSTFLQNKTLQRRVRLIAGDGTTVFVDFATAPNYLPGRHVLIISDVTERTHAEMKISEQLDTVEAARAEAEALRKATLALSQNLAMDSVLDTLLQCISGLVPFDKATVLFVEEGPELIVAREAPRVAPKRSGLTLNLSENVFLERVVFEKKGILLQDVAKQSEWRDVQPLGNIQSWLGIPLVAAGRVLGILSLGTNARCIFTAEHLRLAKSLAIPAAVAIQNARVHERAEIYATELEARLKELREAQKALGNLKKKSLASNDL
jgi:PAS domain S-box-containing protein